ncbi:hypothetical protein [Burkholderia pseudomallei]|uniref:hypothetical protein n=1 Tax=Burkholderia pseudomallei TaxID=28450 RepID=UPI000A1A06F5|nr:hypothetical protein [Burkholderia pseudomallei]ARL96026.1 hypothetical protein BOC58_24335 [Burkholderia pseudomallei]
MPLYQAIIDLKNSLPKSEDDAQRFLDTLPQIVQEQLIAGIYIGRDHLHATTLRSDEPISRTVTDHIDSAEYARIVYEKGSNAVTYLDKLVECAKASNFDLNTL